MNNIEKFFIEYGKIKKLKKWEFLYKKTDNDSNIYFIKKWEIILRNWNEDIAVVGENEISWEKSFLEWTWKPIDAFVNKDIKVYFINHDEFKKLDLEIQNEFLSQLVLFVSNRVYLLNDIVTNVSKINEKIIFQKPKLDINYLKSLFTFIDLENIYLYKMCWENELIPIFESKLNFSLQDFVRTCEQNNVNIKLEKNLTFIKMYEYILILEWEYKKQEYIINNILLHSVWTLKYLCTILEEEKNNQLSGFLD